MCGRASSGKGGLYLHQIKQIPAVVEDELGVTVPVQPHASYFRSRGVDVYQDRVDSEAAHHVLSFDVDKNTVSINARNC